MSAATDALVDEIMQAALLTAQLDTSYDQWTDRERAVARVGMLAAVGAMWAVLDQRDMLELRGIE